MSHTETQGSQRENKISVGSSKILTSTKANISKALFMNLNFLSSKIIQAAIAVHKELGPGLLESVYQDCMLIELCEMDVNVESEIPLPVFYRGRKIKDEGFRLDLLIEDLVIVELKSVEMVQPVHKKQLLTYLRLANKPLGLLINFGNGVLKDGISRIINNRYQDKW